LNSGGCSFQPGVAEKTLRSSALLAIRTAQNRESSAPGLTMQLIERRDEFGKDAADDERANHLAEIERADRPRRKFAKFARGSLQPRNTSDGTSAG
jgi:hypothetical protein